jgi:prepilin-type N-terminal cleavage/methylation domain-containing protein
MIMTAPTPLSKHRGFPARNDHGFTLTETLVTIIILAIVTGALVTIILGAMRSKTTSTNEIESAQAATAAMDWIADDLRSAGYEADLAYPGTPQPGIAYIDSTQVLICSNKDPFPDTTVVKRGMPQAYQPTGSPRPRPLNGTSWEPPVKYRTGAEVTRYTLDVNDDGVINVTDLNQTISSDAARTPNPNDYVLVRSVYGDSTNGSLGNNGGSPEKLALIRAPGGGVPPIFTVYFKSSTQPWDWAGGPVPVSRLNDIDRVLVQVTTESPEPNSQQRYARTTMRTQVQVGRNKPSFLVNTYVVDGYVYWDQNKNHVKDGLEPGIDNVAVRLGSIYSTVSNASGYFLLRAPAGTYSLKHTPAASYGNFNNPDSFVVTLGPGATRSFADTALAGGYVISTAWKDLNSNQIKDAGEPGVSGLQVTVSGGAPVALTDVNGKARQFAKTGPFTATLDVPDSLTCTTSNPFSGTMIAGDSVLVKFALSTTPPGYVTGKVYRDDNRNGVADAGEPGIQNVFVSVVSGGGSVVQGYAYTDASGNYTITVPSNNPPGTNVYYVTVIPPPGFFPSTATSLGPLLVNPSQTLSGKNFGMAAYQIISLDASRVLSLASVDLQERDWTGNNPATAHADADLVLGADAGGTDNVSVWFNQYNGTPLYSTSPSNPNGYTRNAPQSVISMAVDTLDTTAPSSRPDLVTGTKAGATGNFFVWFNQNSSGNEGYFPSTFSTGQNYWTQDIGDVTAVLTLNCAGGAKPDIIVGTRSTIPGRGSIEVWQNSDATTPTFSRQEVFPPAGSIPLNQMGEVAGMQLADVDLDGRKDLVVATRTMNYDGELLIFQNIGNTNGNRFKCVFDEPLGEAGTSVACVDVNRDGKIDIVVGTQRSSNSGSMIYFRNDTVGSNIDFFNRKTVSAPGIVTALVAGDFGGTSFNDLAMGWRQDDAGYGGGVLIYPLDVGTLTNNGSDPSAGAITNFTAALAKNNFNYGVNPVTPSPPYLTDFAAGVKTGASTGALVVFIR